MEVIKFKLYREYDKLIFHILDQNPDYRYIKDFEHGRYVLLAKACPELRKHTVFIRGEYERLDLDQCSCVFDSAEEAEEAKLEFLKLFYLWMKSINPLLEMTVDNNTYEF